MKKFLLQLLPLIISTFSGTAMAQAQATHESNLSLADRVAYQYAIEEVYWRHRIWPKENAGPKPPLDKVVSPAQVQRKVENYLRASRALAEVWHRPITSGQLQAEMDRMARDTKQPGVLRELFEALNNDPAIIAECMARPLLAERLVRELASSNESRGERPIEVERGAYPERDRYTLPELEGNNCTDDSWTTTNITSAPAERNLNTTVWTGTEMIVWGGNGNDSRVNTGGRYNPSTDSWVATSTNNAPVARYDHTAIWTGTEMVVWGGVGDVMYENTGGRYNPSADSWVTTTTNNAASGRYAHTVIWTGTEMIVWGGFSGNFNGLNTGGRYDPSTDSWVATSTTGAPNERYSHTAVWTGSEMLIWGGNNNQLFPEIVGKYNPATDNWVSIDSALAPVGRQGPTAVWTGSEMIVWGGANTNGALKSGGRFNPNTNQWVATTSTHAPTARAGHTAVWTGNEMVIWGGGFTGSSYLNTGGRYNPSTNSWDATSTTNAPVGRQGHTAVWTGNEMIVWGGTYPSNSNDGGRYCAQPPPTPSPSPTPPATPTPPTTPTPTPTPGATPTPTASPSATPTTTPATFGNISTRLRVETGDNVLIGGFIVTGTQSKRVIVRAIGPSLPFPGVLADPFLELRDASGALIRSNDNWRDEQEAEIIATTIPPANDLESAIVATLPANAASYTATVSGVNNGTGIGVVEVYDLDQAVNSKLANISTRGLVQTGDNVLIGGLIVLGQNPLRVIVRAIGPSLPVPDALADPTLELRDGNGGLVAANDNWRSDQEAEIIATTIPPSNDLESAIVRNLPPGNYTGIVSGVDNATGVGLVEAYNLNN
jgi:N-acetylneuraminic acid mutarotase